MLAVETSARVHPSPPATATGGEELAALADGLERSEWSARAVETALPRLLELTDTLHVSERTAWLTGLRRVWRRQGWALSDTGLARFVELTAAWSDWPLSIAAIRALERRRELDAHEACCAVTACRQIGELTEATARCRTRMFAFPREAWPLAEYDALIALSDFRDVAAPTVDSDALRLEPLGHHHVRDFAHQYYDPAIAALCCLPEFSSDAQWHHWLDACWSYGDQRLYAVIDPEWGFVGSVSLVLHDGIGFFYYWIGRDFQGCGVGTAAVHLLLDHARGQHGMRTCYAKVFDYNAPSRRALEKLGFTALDFRPTPPDEDEMFYRLGPSQSRERAAEELRVLFERMQSETRVAVPIRGVDGARRTR